MSGRFRYRTRLKSMNGAEGRQEYIGHSHCEEGKVKMEPPESHYTYPQFILRRGASSSLDRDDELKQAVFERKLFIYVDEWNNKRTMEARAYGLAHGWKPVLIGYQLDGDRGIAPEQMWKTIDDLDRVLITTDVYESSDRTMPPQYAGQVVRFDAVSPDTSLDLTKHPADGC